MLNFFRVFFDETVYTFQENNMLLTLLEKLFNDFTLFFQENSMDLQEAKAELDKLTSDQLASKQHIDEVNAKRQKLWRTEASVCVVFILFEIKLYLFYNDIFY